MAEDSGPDPSAWLVTFGDLITLLLTFFVLMLSMSAIDKQRVSESFVYFTGKPFVLKGTEGEVVTPVEEKQPSAEEQIRRGMEIANVLEGLIAPLARKGEISSKEVRVDALGEVRVKGDPRGQVIVFSGSFLFTPGMAVLKVNAFPVLNAIANLLRGGGENITVEGHTDDLEWPANPLYKDRWDLSAARAVNVLKYLIEGGKLSGKRLAAVGYADTRPVVPFESKGGRRRNRRVEVIIAKPEG